MSKDSDPQILFMNLIIPIYIDTNALLDVVASIEGGAILLHHKQYSYRRMWS